MLKTSAMDHENALAVLQSLPPHILEAIPLKVLSGVDCEVTLLSVYLSDDGQELVVDIDLE